ncbi:MAG: efflux RND transporter periplasmic adaptor subunit [Flavobacterium sp.]
MKTYKSIVALFLLAIVVTACKNDASDKNDGVKAIPVITEQLSETSHSSAVSVSGNIEGNKTVRLGFMVAGKINQINVDEGQNVNNGQLVATLDPTNYSIAKEIADVQAGEANDQYNRLKIMHDRNSISESDFKKIDFSLKGAKAQQKLQGKNLSDTKLFAPLNGILLQKLAEPGEIVATGTPILVVSDISKVKVNAYIPENQLSQINIGQQATVYIGALDETFTGKVAEVGGIADAATRAFTIKIEVQNPKRLIRPGMIAEISLPSSKETKTISVPANAILHTPEGQSFVFIADKEKGQAFQRNISLGSINADRIEIISGVSVGEILITGGQQKLTNGTKISINGK